eukprot:3776127-Amphidinium_carterae.2
MAAELITPVRHYVLAATSASSGENSNSEPRRPDSTTSATELKTTRSRSIFAIRPTQYCACIPICMGVCRTCPT